MNTKPAPNFFEKHVNSEGFSVQYVFPYKLIYKEDAHEMLIFVEPLAGTIPFEIYPESMSYWAPPFSSEPVTKEKKTQIIENIRKIFKGLGYEIDIVP